MSIWFVRPVRAVLLSGAAAACGVAMAASAQAQMLPAPQVSQPVVQKLPVQSAGMKLNDALGRLARNPQDVEALIAAGRASLELGDVQAAVGFYQRADVLWPGSARVKAGLAGAYALSGDPITAIELFKEAERLGPLGAEPLADRALAYDLVGDNQTAQLYYRRSLALAESDETLRRMALSLAISGDRRGMEAALSPLLQRQDKAAWRTRAFALAILGESAEAESIARQTMPADMAGAIANYFRFMPKLSPAQQASAVNLGHFPRAAEMGQDDPRFAQYARPRAVLAVVTPSPQPDAKGKGKDKGKDKGKGSKTPQVAAVVVPEPQVGREVEGKPVQLAALTPSPKPVPVAAPVAKPAPLPVPPPPKPAPLPVRVPAPLPVPVPKPAPRPSPSVSGPGFVTLDPADPKSGSKFSLASAAPAPTPVVPAPVPKPAPVPAPKPDSIDDAFADFTPPSREVEPQAGAVDVRKMKAAPAPAKPQTAADIAKDTAKEKGKAKDSQPSHPSRIWVQIGVGRDKAALGSDWRKLIKDDPEVFKGKRAFVSAWGQSNRLLAGPFESQKEASAFLVQLRKAGVPGAFVWSSPAGQVVDPLSGGK